jgi:hypothetical protein
LGFDFGGARGAAIFSAATFEAADDTHGHIVVAVDLAAQSGVMHTASIEDFFFGHGLLRWFAVEEFDAACGASGFTAASVQLVRSCFFAKGENKSFTLWDVEFAEAFDG